jgi:hypothetical protein
MGVILPDSGYLQEEEAKRKNARLDKANAPDDASAPASLKLNSKVNSKGKNPRSSSKSAVKTATKDASGKAAAPRFAPLYTQEEAQASLKVLRTVDYDQRYSVTDAISFTFTEAGHILGAAVVNLEIGTGSQKRTFCFSGNIGRPDMPLLRDLQPVAAADYVMVEATYGNRLAPEARSPRCARSQAARRSRSGQELWQDCRQDQESPSRLAPTPARAAVSFSSRLSRLVGLRLCSTTSAS